MNAEPAWKTYLKVGIALFPTMFWGLFFSVVYFPRIEAILQKAGLLGENPAPSTALFRFFITVAYSAFHNFYVILAVSVGVLAMAEVWFKPWDRMRRRVCIVLAVLFNAFVLFGMCATTVSVLVAVRVMERAQSP